MTTKYLQALTQYLSGSGVVIGATSIVLTSLTDIYGNAITNMTPFGSKGYITLEPDTVNEEAATFTSVTVNANGTVTLGGVSTLLAQSPYTETSGLVRGHSGGTKVVITDNVGFWNTFANKNNDETIAGLWSAPDPVANQGIATKAYVLSVVNGGTVSFDQEIVSGTAGEALTAGQVVYLKNDGLWYKASSATSATCLNVSLGIVQANASSSAACAVLVSGTDKTQTGLVAGTTYYLGTGGALSTSAGTVTVDIGEATATNRLNFAPFFSTAINTANALSKLSGTFVPTSSLKFGGTGADGALAISSGTTTIDLGNAAVVVKNYTSIAITGTGKLAFSNPATNGTVIVLKSQGAVTLTSSQAPMIDCSGLGAPGGAGATNGAGATGTAGLTWSDVLVPAGSGGANGGTVGGGGGGASCYNNGTTISGGGGGGTAPLTNSTLFSIVFKFLKLATGGGGGGAAGSNASSTGGNGGRGGGALSIECGGALNFTTAGGISVAGVAGTAGTSGNSSAAGGGGGGGGGLCVVLYTTLTVASGTITVSGGTGGTGVNTGTNGGVGGAGLSLVAANTEF